MQNYGLAKPLNTATHNKLVMSFRGSNYISLSSRKTFTKQPLDTIVLMIVLWKINRYSKQKFETISNYVIFRQVGNPQNRQAKVQRNLTEAEEEKGTGFW